MIWLQRKDAAGWTVWIAEQEIPALLDLPLRLRELLTNPDFSDRIVERLFPSAYLDDPDREREYQELLRDDLVCRKLEGLECVEKSLKNRRTHRSTKGPRVMELDLSDEDLVVWIGFLHDMRLVIGTALDISNEGWERDLDPEDPDFDELLLLNQLAYLEEALVEALRDSEGLDGSCP